MSLEKDITEIKKVAEQDGKSAEDLFKPATPEEAKLRKRQINVRNAIDWLYGHEQYYIDNKLPSHWYSLDEKEPLSPSQRIDNMNFDLLMSQLTTGITVGYVEQLNQEDKEEVVREVLEKFKNFKDKQATTKQHSNSKE